ncbi:transposase-like protein [Paraburkholderia sp. WSM4179]|nr:transposase-like protein [Paraburkholderia sp. WSM4179]
MTSIPSFGLGTFRLQDQIVINSVLDGLELGRAPQTITLDGYAASHRAVREMKTDESLPRRTKLRSSKCLNNLIEQDHRHIKSRVNVMLGFKRFHSAAVILSGIELMHRIRKGQFDLTSMHLKNTTSPSIWMALLSAR